MSVHPRRHPLPVIRDPHHTTAIMLYTTAKSSVNGRYYQLFGSDFFPLSEENFSQVRHKQRRIPLVLSVPVKAGSSGIGGMESGIESRAFRVFCKSQVDGAVRSTSKFSTLPEFAGDHGGMSTVGVYLMWVVQRLPHATSLPGRDTNRWIVRTFRRRYLDVRRRADTHAG